MKLVSWNLEGRLSDLATDDRGTPEKIIAALTELNADVSVHPEAFGADPAMRPEIETALRALGYSLEMVAYDDLVSRGDKAAVSNPHIMVMSKLPVVHTQVIRPGNLRNMLALHLYDPVSNSEFRVIAIHLEDREEVLRLKQVEPLIEYINSSPIPTVIMGDFNAMPPNTRWTRFLHSGLFRDPAKLIPHRHMRYTLSRLSDMASGTTITAILGKTALVNTDPLLEPTTTPKMRKMEWMPSIRIAKIDWIFVSPDITYQDFAVSRDLGSDHRALSVKISLK